MSKIVSRQIQANTNEISFTNDEIMLIMALLHTSSFRTYGNSYAYHAYSLAEKLFEISGITTSDAVKIVDPAVNIIDSNGNYLSTYVYTDFRIVFK